MVRLIRAIRSAQLAGRLYDNATVQEGEQPAEDPKELLAILPCYSSSVVQLADWMTLSVSRSSRARASAFFRYSGTACGAGFESLLHNVCPAR